MCHSNIGAGVRATALAYISLKAPSHSSFAPPNEAGAPCSKDREKFPADRFEKSIGQHAVGNARGITLTNRPQIRPGPDKTICLGEYDPRALVIEPEAMLGGHRNFDGKIRICRRRVRDRQYRDHPLVLRAVADKNYRARPILAALFLSAAGFIRPKIAVSDDKAGDRVG